MSSKSHIIVLDHLRAIIITLMVFHHSIPVYSRFANLHPGRLIT